MLESIKVAPELVCSTETLYLPDSAISFFTNFNAESLRLVFCVVLPSEIGCYQLKKPWLNKFSILRVLTKLAEYKQLEYGFSDEKKRNY
jgi:hypothetical protein